MTIHEFLAAAIGDTAAAALAGGAGGAVRWIKFREDWRTGVGSIFVGALCSIYASPIIEPFLEKFIANPGKRAGFAGFAIGVGGIMLVGFFIDFLKSRKAAITGREDQK